MTWLCFTVVKIKNQTKKTIVCTNKLADVNSEDTWAEVIKETSDVEVGDVYEIVGRVKKGIGEGISISKEQLVSDALDFEPIKYVTCSIYITTTPEETVETPLISINDVLVNNSYKYARHIKNQKLTFKDILFNDLVTEMIAENIRFPSIPQESINRYVNVIVNCLWYIDGNMETVINRSKNNKNVLEIPTRFVKYNGKYNDWKRKKKKKPQLSSKELQIHASLLQTLTEKNFTTQWGSFIKDVESLGLSLHSYAQYLEEANKKQCEHHNMTHPSKQIKTDVTIRHCVKEHLINEKYRIISDVLQEMSIYEPLIFNEDDHVGRPFQNRNERHSYFNTFAVIAPVDMLRYNPGGSIGAVTVLWRVPCIRDPNEMMTKGAQIVKELEEELPEFHTRQMRREFSKHVDKLNINMPSHVMRNIYADLTLDATKDQNPLMDERLRQAILGDDPNLIVDMRHSNSGRPSDSFNVFFEKLKEKTEQLAAADERRHGVSHFSQYISVRDLIEQTAKACPENTNIPSESTVLFAFVPKNSYTNAAKLYKGIIDMKFKVQSRQLRASHQDDWYCNAVLKYFRSYAILNKEITRCICIDDKSKLDYGEPGYLLSTGVRGKKSLIPVSSVLGALDHDVNQRASLTPSVILDVDIPSEYDSFYRGQVTVTLKDSVFEASSPFRHAQEILEYIGDCEEQKSILQIYSDGGPDHRLVYHSVKLSLIGVFKKLNLDLLIAARTAPGHSWVNPVERVMSIINLVYQNMALNREETTADLEHEIKKSSGLESLRKTKDLEEPWKASLVPMKEMLSERTERVALKGKPFKSRKPASKEDIAQLESWVINQVDPTISQGKYTDVELKKSKDYHTFVAAHCRLRHYTFQIRKCDDVKCCGEKTRTYDWLPDPELNEKKDHFKDFEALVGKKTTQKDMPSGTNETVAAVAQALQGCKNDVLVGQNVRQTVRCFECNKPRCIYSKKALAQRTKRTLDRLLEKYDYSCGASITSEGDLLHGMVFVRLQLNCRSHIEFSFYASLLANNNLCCNCGRKGAEKNKEWTAQFKTVLPTCQLDDCKIKKCTRGKKK